MNLKSKFFAIFLSIAITLGISATAFNNANASTDYKDNEKKEKVHMNGHWWIITYDEDGGVIEVHLDDFDE